MDKTEKNLGTNVPRFFEKVRMTGLEPARSYPSLEPESSASANSATSACGSLLLDNKAIIPAFFLFVKHFFYFFSFFCQGLDDRWFWWGKVRSDGYGKGMRGPFFPNKGRAVLWANRFAVFVV